MEVSYSSSHTYVLLEDEMIETNGGFVCRAFDEDLGRYLCVKAVDTDDPKCAMEEVKTLSRFSSELTSLPQIFDTHYDKKQKRLYIFMKLFGVIQYPVAEIEMNLQEENYEDYDKMEFYVLRMYRGGLHSSEEIAEAMSVHKEYVLDAAVQQGL